MKNPVCIRTGLFKDLIHKGLKESYTLLYLGLYVTVLLIFKMPTNLIHMRNPTGM